MSTPLPLGFVVQLNQRTRIKDGGLALIGGSPTRVLYMKPAAVELIVNGRVTVTDEVSAYLADRLLETGIADPVVEALADILPSGVTYVVPVRDRPKALDRLLASIPRGAKVIVVDDASVHPDVIVRLAERHGAEIVPLPKNLGAAGARNAGMARVSTEFVAFVDSDVVLPADSIPLMLRHFVDPRVAMVAPRVVGMGGTERASWINRYEDALSSLDLGRHPAIVRPRALVSWVSGTTLLCRTSQLGPGFTADMRSGEDVDLVWRLAEEGYRVRYEPAATVLHEHRSTVRAWMRRKAFYGTGAFKLGERHPNSIAPVILPPWGVVLILALLAQRRWSVPVALTISVVTVLHISTKLRRSAHPIRLATELTANGAVASLVQLMALLLRHWWPAAAVAALFSQRLRRAIAVAHIADTAIEYARTGARLDPIRFGIARRLDDLAYGAGVWFSVVKGRSIRALLPNIRRSSD